MESVVQKGPIPVRRVVHGIAENKRSALWAIGLFLAYLPLCFMGPGSDGDSLLVVHSAREWLATDHYFGFRLNPGYWVHDVIATGIGSIGGITLVNISTAIITAIGAVFFYRLLKEDQIPHPRLWATVYALHPIVWVNAASLIDYNWALTSLMIGFWAFRNHRFGTAITALGLATGIRLASFFIFPILIASDLVQRAEGWRKRVLISIAGWGVGGLFYLARFLDMGFEFLAPNPGGNWTLVAHVGRFIYKSIYFWGLPQTLLLTGILTIGWFTQRKQSKPTVSDRIAATIGISVTMVVIFHGLFARYPYENEYLLPCFPFEIYLIATALRTQKKLAISAAIIILSYNFVSINVLRPDTPLRATKAIPGLWLEPGYLVQDTIERLKVETKTPNIPNRLTRLNLLSPTSPRPTATPLH